MTETMHEVPLAAQKSWYVVCEATPQPNSPTMVLGTMERQQFPTIEAAMGWAERHKIGSFVVLEQCVVAVSRTFLTAVSTGLKKK